MPRHEVGATSLRKIMDTLLIFDLPQAIETDQIISNVIGTLLLLRLISIKYYLRLFWKYHMKVLLLFKKST